jgi:hypothetical protein
MLDKNDLLGVPLRGYFIVSSTSIGLFGGLKGASVEMLLERHLILLLRYVNYNSSYTKINDKQ